jgi:hypothetical protein
MLEACAVRAVMRWWVCPFLAVKRCRCQADREQGAGVGGRSGRLASDLIGRVREVVSAGATRNRFAELLEAGGVPRDRLTWLAGEQFVSSAATSAVSRCSRPVSRTRRPVRCSCPWRRVSCARCGCWPISPARWGGASGICGRTSRGAGAGIPGVSGLERAVRDLQPGRCAGLCLGRPARRKPGHVRTCTRKLSCSP